MLKKMIKLAAVGVATLGLVGTASAATYTVNMCGASAQAGFWEASGAAIVQSSLNCTGGAVLDGLDDKNMIVRGLNCTADGTGTNDDTVFVRYKVENSQFGCENFNGVTSSGWAAGDDEGGDCTFDGTPFDCTVAVDADCQLGCADVPCDTITATTFGYADGRAGAPSQGGSDPYIQHGNSAGFDISAADTFYLGVTVPFGFIINNAVTDYQCTKPDQDELGANQHLAYCKENWECDPRYNTPENYNPQCRGDWKCIDAFKAEEGNAPGSDGIGVCLDGNQDPVDLDKDMTSLASTGINGTSKACVDASDCKMPLEITECAPRTLKNVSRLMVLHIFSDAVENWSDFGPSFPDLAIVKCARHGGSGTHQTLLNTVFRGDATFSTFTNEFPAGPGGAAGLSHFWHYKSSSDLTRDCVAYYAGGIGYVDADKVMFRSKIDKVKAPAAYADGTYYGISQLMYQGVAPSRLSVAMGKYNFWAQQRCFVNSNVPTAIEAQILDDIMNGAADPAQLTFANFGQRALFWATQGEMRVEKVNEFAYPTRVSPDPGFPPIDSTL